MVASCDYVQIGSQEDRGTNTWQHTSLMIPKTDKLHQNRDKNDNCNVIEVIDLSLSPEVKSRHL